MTSVEWKYFVPEEAPEQKLIEPSVQAGRHARLLQRAAPGAGEVDSQKPMVAPSRPRRAASTASSTAPDDGGHPG